MTGREKALGDTETITLTGEANPENIDLGLTKLDLKALHKADTIAFNFWEGNHHITAIKENKKDPYEPYIRYKISVKGRFATRGEGVKSCHTSSHHYFSERGSYIQTIISLIKVGDKIELEWYPDGNTNGYLEKNNLHGDLLHLHVLRGKKHLVFDISHAACENNTARMVRYSDSW